MRQGYLGTLWDIAREDIITTSGVIAFRITTWYLWDYRLCDIYLSNNQLWDNYLCALGINICQSS